MSWKTNGPWEYRVVQLDTRFKEQQAELMEWGEIGWELVSVTHDPDGDGRVAYFKRPRGFRERHPTP